MSDHPTLIETFTRHRAAFVLRLPFGVLLKDDMAYLLKATARDCGVTVKEARDALLQHWLDLPPARTPPRVPGATAQRDHSATDQGGEGPA